MSMCILIHHWGKHACKYIGYSIWRTRLVRSLQGFILPYNGGRSSFSFGLHGTSFVSSLGHCQSLFHSFRLPLWHTHTYSTTCTHTRAQSHPFVLKQQASLVALQSHLTLYKSLSKLERIIHIQDSEYILNLRYLLLFCLLGFDFILSHITTSSSQC